ncbi:vacuolar protein sorting-associated protein 45 [Nematocida homosporus]|uniref:vacuolar protein sorting-associated protein 45 n=1 Tax=Nematocida homosporus TaxID=1912981 RepID=UPI00221F7E19|nr:vacuolar protein sorting-associated protein 45 [Nematocida homosporus]KAI5186989.1 vacuolar protein sorting-associated protein 45 [Nematocida homosporus]
MDVLLKDIRSALGRGEGIKTMLLDEFTKKALSPLISHSELLSYDFFLFEMIARERPAIAVSCVTVIAKASLPLLLKELAAPKYREYFLFVTNEMSNEEISQVADKDIHGVVREFQELYIGGVPMDTGLVLLSEDTGLRCAQQLVCALKGFGLVPSVRFQFGSEVSYQTAEVVASAFADQKSCNADLLVVERAFDLFTPLMYTWSYQSMAGEYLDYRPGILHWGENSLCLTSDDLFFEKTKFMDILSATTFLRDSLKTVKESRDTIGEYVATIRQKAKDSERLIMHLKALSEISKACLANDLAAEALAETILGVDSEEVSATNNYSEEQKIKLALISYLSETIPGKHKLPNIFRSDKKPDQNRQSMYRAEIEQFKKQFVNSKVDLRRPTYEKNTNRKLGYIPVICALASKLKAGTLSNSAYPSLKSSTDKKKALVVFISGGATFLEHRSLQLWFAQKYPDQICIIISDRIIRSSDILSSIIHPKKDSD